MPANRVPLRYGAEHPDPDERPQAGSVGSHAAPGVATGTDRVGEVYMRAGSPGGKTDPAWGKLARQMGWKAPGDIGPGPEQPDPQELLEWSDWVAVLGAVDRHGADACRKWITEYLAENPNGKLVK